MLHAPLFAANWKLIFQNYNECYHCPTLYPVLNTLTPAQIMKVASGNTLLCRFRMDDDMVWNLITSHGKGAANDGMSRLHASILMAGRHQEAA